MNNRYIIGSGYYSYPDDSHGNTREFLDIWIRNTKKFSKPRKIIIVTSDSPLPLYIDEMHGEFNWDPNTDKTYELDIDIINLPYNPGHSLKKNNSILCGWQSSFIIGAMIAYSSNCDFIYKEQDCLCFGNWIDKVYNDAKRSPILMGEFKADKTMKNEISLVYIERNLIPKFVQTLLMVLDENLFNNPYPEAIMGDVAEMLGYNDYHFSFGYGRDRPINYDDDGFFIQHIGYHKYKDAVDLTKELVDRGLL